MVDVISTFIPSPEINYFDLGPIRIRFYALFILAGIAAATVVTARRLPAAGINRSVAGDVAIWAVVFGIIGARLYHVVTHPGDYFFPGAQLARVLYIWEGGIAIFGAVVFGAIGVWVGVRRAGVPFLAYADALAPGLLLAQAIGRIGNYFNQELFGTPTTLPWGLQINSDNAAFPAGLPAGTLFHPLFLYELLWNLVGVSVILLFSRQRRIGSGVAVGGYFLWYGIGRAWFESFRLDGSQLHILGIAANQITAVTAALVGLTLVGRALRRDRMMATPTTTSRDDSRSLV